MKLSGLVKAGILILSLGLGCRTDGIKDADTDKNWIDWRQQDGLLSIKRWTDNSISSIPDSISKLEIRHLSVECPDLVDYNGLLQKINPRKLISIIIQDFHGEIWDIDLRRFKTLVTLDISSPTMKKVVFTNNFSSQLELLFLSSPWLEFPQFDSSLLNLGQLHYGGVSKVIPKWLENLKNLRVFIFESEVLEKIECNVCKMDRLRVLGIVDSRIPDKETYLKNHPLYLVLEEIRKCKPNISFWQKYVH